MEKKFFADEQNKRHSPHAQTECRVKFCFVNFCAYKSPIKITGVDLLCKIGVRNLHADFLLLFIII